MTLPTGVRPALAVGQGFDVHPFSDDPSRALVLGGVVITEAPGLAGHSDADVLTHALADAVLGAAGLGDLGRHFPDTDPSLAGADSVGILRHVVTLVDAEGLGAVQADCTVVCERPRLAGYLAEMGGVLGEVLGAPVNVKAARAEGLGALGRAEGIAALAVVLLAAADGPSGRAGARR